MITIDELMTESPYTLRPTDSLDAARRLMTEKNIRHIPITDDDNQLRGLVTQRDILQATDPNQKNQDLALSNVMIKDVSVIHTTDSVRQAALHLRQKKYGCLPVVANNQLVGIVTDSDFISVAINLLEQVEITEEEIGYEPDEMDDLDMPTIEEDF